MIEDPKLTRRILEYFAQDDVPFPANATVADDLTSAFPDEKLSRLEYHVMCAEENELLIVNTRENSMMDGTEFVFGFISGLTAKGGEYVRGSRSKYWDEAYKQISNKGIEVTTKLLIQVMSKLMSSSLSAAPDFA